MKSVLIWSVGCALVILLSLTVKEVSPMLITGILLAGGVSLIGAVCWKGR